MLAMVMCVVSGIVISEVDLPSMGSTRRSGRPGSGSTS